MQQHNYTEIERALSAYITPGQVFELRLLPKSNGKRTDSGYFTSAAEAASAIVGLEHAYTAIYFTPNPVVPDLAARSYNRIDTWVRYTTQDADILERKWLLIDVDPIRPAGISSTNTQLAHALKITLRIAAMLELDGWPRPIVGMSGNGYHLTYAIREPNNAFVRDEIAKFLKILDAQYNDGVCEVDTSVFNASRIWKVPGTWARKGDDVPDRPHRKASLIQMPVAPALVTLSLINAYNHRNEHVLPVNGKAALNGTKHKQEYPDDERKYRNVNSQAMTRLHEWVLEYFPFAKEYQQGYRIASADLGMSYEEDLTIHPWPRGIKYFGVHDLGDATEGRRTPISLLTEFCFNGDKDLAARKLADTLKCPLTEFSPLPNIDLSPKVHTLPGIEGPKAIFDFGRIPTVGGLLQERFKEPKWVIRDVLPVGAILLAARPKMRKTFLAMQLSLAVAAGRPFLGWQCEQGDVLFLGLEDNKRRFQSRIKLLQTFDLNPPELLNFRYWTNGVDISPTTGKEFISDVDEYERTLRAFPQGQEGVDALNRFLDQYPNTRLIVIDTYARFRDRSNNRDIYQRDYDQMMPITQLCNQREVCGLIIHHEKKGLAGNDSADFMEDVSGSSGITGAVDGVMSLKGPRGKQYETEQRKLLISGRDIPHDFEIDINFDAKRGGWLTAARQDVRAAILELLKRAPYLNQHEICDLLGSTSQSRIRQVLTLMKHEGVINHGKSGYSLPRELFKGDF